MKKILPYIVIAILIGVIVHLFTSRSDISKRAADNLNALQDSVKYHKNKFNEEVSSKLALQLTEKELKKSVNNGTEENKKLKEAIKNYKTVIATIQSTQIVRIDTIKVPFKDTIKYVFSKNFEIRDKWYQFDQNITNKGFSISNFKLTPNKQTIVVGWKKQGWFKNPKATVELTNSSPLFKQVDMKPIIVVYEKKWHEKWFITIPGGLLFGALIR